MIGADGRQGSRSSAAAVDPAFERNAPYAPTPDNRPVALDRGPLALTRDDGWQMSFGDRAALEGVLAQLRPRLALEIGTAEGASSARIAAYSAEVHSIDLTHEPVSRELPPHVIFHTGSSAELLTPLLASFVDADRCLDFALVDGDHSFEGVRADVTSLLESAATARSVILVHDTMIAEIRAGIESLGLEGYAKVVYYELDFVPGYMFREGECRGAVWEGIGLLLTETDRSPAYPLGPRQSRYYEPFALFQRLRKEILEQGALEGFGSSADPAIGGVPPTSLYPGERDHAPAPPERLHGRDQRRGGPGPAG